MSTPQTTLTADDAATPQSTPGDGAREGAEGEATQATPAEAQATGGKARPALPELPGLGADAPVQDPDAVDVRAGLWLRAEDPDFAPYAEALLASCLVSDPWNAGDAEQRFYNAPLELEPWAARRLEQVAADIGALVDEAMGLLWAQPELVDQFYRLTPYQKLMWLASGGHWHGFARMDMFICQDGSIKICEFNADTPSGQTDAVVPNALMHARYPHLRDPNAEYAARFKRMFIRAYQAATGREGAPRRVGMVYPTDQPEDISIIRLYQRWFEEAGCATVLGSPYNLEPGPVGQGPTRLMGEPIDFILRHYKTDWWGERLPVWTDDEPYPDPDPLAEPLLCMIEAERAGELAVINPLGSILAQNKVTLALFWEELARFSPKAQATIRAHTSPTYRIETLGREALKGHRADWVLKSDFGCEGDEVIIGPYVTQEQWERALDTAVEGIWVAQRFFQIAPLDDRWLPNYGMYLIAGLPSGYLVRLDPLGHATGYASKVVPTLIQPDPAP